MSGKVLFVSQNPLGRCENLTAVWNAYDGPKEFRLGQDSMRTAETDGFAAVVCDALPAYIDGKDRCKSINICHGITGNKVYGLHEWHGYDSEAFAQTDIAVAASDGTASIVAGQLGIQESRVAVLGFPRTDAIIGRRKGDGGTFMAGKRAYLYAPTFRDCELGGWLPAIDWEIVDGLLGDGEVVALKRHYFTGGSFLGSEFAHVVELGPMEPLAPYLIDCDVLLTDYSSCIADAYLLGKPAVLTVDDMGDYLRDRPMYYEYPRAYCSRWICAEGNEEALVGMLRRAADDGIGETERRYRDLVAGACDGRSTERVCELIEACCR